MKSIKYIFFAGMFVFFSCKNDSNTNTQAPISSENGNGNGNGNQIEVSKAQFTNTKMELGSLKEQEFSTGVQSSGTVNVPLQNLAAVSAFSGGYIKNLPLLVGTKVRKGERLVTIENPEFITIQQNYLEAAEQLRFLKSEYDRQKTLLEENITSEKSFLKAESEYKTTLARANSLKKNLEMLNIQPEAVLEGKIVSQVNIYSPIDGYITNILVQTGAYVSPADKIIEVINTDDLHLELKVFEKDLLQLKKGQEVIFRVPEISDKTFSAKLNLVGANIDPNTRMAVLQAHINKQEDENFSVGMFIEATIITSSLVQEALPEDAVVELDGKNYVLVLDNQDTEGYTFHPQEVEIEKTYNGFTCFKTQLDPKAKLLTKGGYSLLQSEEQGEF